MMSRKKLKFFKLATFLLALAPFVMENSRSFLMFTGEPEVPTKYMK